MNYTLACQLTQRLFAFAELETTPVSELCQLLELADDMYYNDASDSSPLTDAQYDTVKQYSARLDPTNRYFIGVGANVRGGKIKLPYEMGSLNQVQIGELKPWIKSMLSLFQATFLITSKLDGASAMVVYDSSGKLQIAYSRGNGVEGADITRHVMRIASVPKQIPITYAPMTIRAENIISVPNFTKSQHVVMSRSGKPYVNPRNMVSGLMNATANESAAYEIIDLIAYEIMGHPEQDKLDQLKQLVECGFKIPTYSTVNVADATEELFTQTLNDLRKTSEYELDGIVVDVNEGSVREQLHDPSVINPKYAFKYKVADGSNHATPTVTGVTWAISKDGYYKPTIQIEPTPLCGVTIQNCTGFNAKFIKENLIGPGAKIVLTRSGDVIPFCQRVIEPAPGGAQMPDDDEALWTTTGVDLILADVNANETVKLQRLVDFFNTIDAPHMGEGNLTTIFECGFDSPESIIELTLEDFCSMLGTSIGKKVYTGLKQKLTNIPLYTLMGAHHCFGRGVGVRKMKKLYEHIKGDISKLSSIDVITAAEGFDVKTARKVVAGLEPFTVFTARISEAPIGVTVAPYVAPTEGKWTGKSIVVTGFRDSTVDKLIESHGGKVGSSVSSKTYLVVAADPSEVSGKLSKARELGITIISRQQFMDQYA